MYSHAIVKAESRLRVAQKAASDLKGCSNYHDFVDTWYTFITAAKNVWTVLEQGAKATPQSEQWFGGKARERRDDDLLQYLFEARNDDEHGIEEVTEFVPGYIGIGGVKPGYSNAYSISNVTVSSGVIESGSVRSLDGKPVLIEATSPYARLAKIRPRGRPPMCPPTTHKGEALPDNSPATVADVALIYLQGVIAEARQHERRP